MTVETLEIGAEEDGIRLDRWFRIHYPVLGHGALQKLLRSGQIRLNGRRVKANARLETGQTLRVPPLRETAREAPRARKQADKVSAADSAFMQGLVVHRDDDMIVLNKPPGLAVQGGSKTPRHVDGLLDALTFDAGERPRLVHRLDRDTSGLLVLARHRASASALAKLFKARSLRKIYWALVIGVPKPGSGTINMALVKAGRAGDQRMRAARHGDDGAQNAVTEFAMIDHAGRRLSWLALWPRTGRTHQLRAHLLELQHPILGDGKYAGEAAFLSPDEPLVLHLHARRLELPRKGRAPLVLEAPLPPHMQASFAKFGFDPAFSGDPFVEVEA